MATIQRANVILQVPDEPDILQRYKDKGFDVIDSKTGKVLERAVPQEAGALRALLVTTEKQVEELTQELDKVQTELDKVRTELEDMTKKYEELKKKKSSESTSKKK